MSAYFPTSKGSYAPIVFVSGLYGLLYAEWYSDVLTKLASHGFIVMGVDTFWPAASMQASRREENTSARIDINEEPEFMFKIVQWVSDMAYNVITEYRPQCVPITLL